MPCRAAATRACDAMQCDVHRRASRRTCTPGGTSRRSSRTSSTSSRCFPCYSIPFSSIPSHSVPFRSIPFRSILSHSVPFHSVPFHFIPSHSVPFHSIPFHSIHFHPELEARPRHDRAANGGTLPATTRASVPPPPTETEIPHPTRRGAHGSPRVLHYVTLHYVALRAARFAAHDVTLRYTTLHYVTLRYTTLHYVALRCTTLHYVALRYTTLHYVTLRYTTLHYVTLRYITGRTVRRARRPTLTAVADCASRHRRPRAGRST